MFIEDAEDEDDEPHAVPENTPFNGLVNPDFPDEPVEEGNRIWATGLFPQAEHIRVTATVFQCLAESFRQNSQPADDKRIPLHLRDFSSVFSKESFDKLLMSKPWDHAVKLTSDVTPKSCKVYPLSVSEQKELDEFLKENLGSGRIRLSKSLMAALCSVKRNVKRRKQTCLHLGFAGSDVIQAIPVVQRWGFCACRLSEFK